MSEIVFLRIDVPPVLEEDFLDALLANEQVEGYQCSRSLGHGEVGSMSIEEQVAGRRERVLFELAIERSAASRVLNELKRRFPLRDIVWWITPIIDRGRFSD